ncbi:MAG TPA: winged helix-turn-helix domain-containing protein [Burkholderiaceae bacterium]|nr:winged helix-turn-helix domain-containing protein [Burkholderiaceae bacterium]
MPSDATVHRASHFAFGRFELDAGRRELRADGKPVVLGARAFDLLLTLVERGGRLVSKNELFDLVWPGVVVEENNIEKQISTLRKVLGARAIATVPGRGYQFTLLGEPAEPEPEPVREAPRPPAEALQASPTGNLPAELPALHGRGDDVIALRQVLESNRIVSVVGPAGIGKTRLAQAVAHDLRSRFPDGAWLIELAPLSDPQLVAPTVGRVLGHLLAPGEHALPSLVEAMRSQRLLLVLDNCEHLVGAVAELVAGLSSFAPAVRVLATSQEPLHVADEQVVRLQPLAVPQLADPASALGYGAVELFVARAKSSDPRFVLGPDNAADVVEICARLDGIPLAIELAAARVPLLGIRGLRQRIDERLKLLGGGSLRRASPRHQTLRAALEWSYLLLSPDERNVFDRLGVFAGSFSLDAVQMLAADASIDASIDDWAVLDHLASLVDKSLVLVEPGREPRYRLLECTRALALEHLEQGGVIGEMRRRHARTMAATLAWRGRLDARAMEGSFARVLRIGPDLDNARAAIAWAAGPGGDRALAVDLLGATHWLWCPVGCSDEADRWFRCVEPWVDETAAPSAAALFWVSCADLRLLVQLPRQAEASMRAATLFQATGDRLGAYFAWLSAAWNLAYCGLRDPAKHALDEAQRLLASDWPGWLAAGLEFALGTWMYCCRVGSMEDARRHFRVAIGKCRDSGGEAWHEQGSNVMIVFCDYALQDYESAARVGLTTLEHPVMRASPWMQAGLRPTVGAALAALGRLPEAADLLRDTVLQLKRATGSACWAFSHVAYLVACQGRLEDAARLVGYVDRTIREGRQIQAPNLQLSYDMVIERVSRELAPDALAALRAAGQDLTDQAAIDVAFPATRDGLAPAS